MFNFNEIYRACRISILKYIWKQDHKIIHSLLKTKVWCLHIIVLSKCSAFDGAVDEKDQWSLK